MKLACARIVATDVSRLTRFYEELTGVGAMGSDEYAEIWTAGAAIAICSPEAANHFGGTPGVAASNRSMILDLEVGDADVEHGRLSRARIVDDWVLLPTTQPWNVRSTSLRDPDGNVVTLFARLPTRPRWRCPRRNG
jgi:hypothetical protein